MAERNADLFRRVADMIEAHPANYDQQAWLMTADYKPPTSLLPDCGTTCCINGWGVWLSATSEMHAKARIATSDAGYFNALIAQLGQPDDSFGLGAELFGITEDEAEWLFDPDWAPEWDPAEEDLTNAVARALRSYADGAPILPEEPNG
jgi:hypothetical protein